MEVIEQAKKWLEESYEDMLLDLADLIACKSVETEYMPGMPFGQGCYDALMCAGKICEKFGFTFHNVDGYIGYMDYEDTGKMPEYGVLCHVDVVPPCNFTTDPYALIRKNGKLIARGVMDDKGPCVIMIYVLAALKKFGFKPSSNIRLMFGCDEESGWKDIYYAKEKNIIPKRGYSPDADYPLINREKGIITLRLQKGLSSLKVASIEGGSASNAVPDVCELVLRMTTGEAEDIYKGTKIQVEPLYQKCNVKVFGTASHASLPFQGDNAIISALKALDEPELQFIYKRFKGTQGKGLGFSNPDLTCTLSRMRYMNGKLDMSVDIRYPHDIEFKEVDAIIKKSLDDFEIEYVDHNPCHSVDESDPLCECLLKAYNMETGENGKAKTIGGGTYSRAFDVGVAFGCTFEYEPMCAHMADEFMMEESVKRNLNIQLQGIYQLCK